MTPDADSTTDSEPPALGRTLCPLVTPLDAETEAVDRDALADLVDHVLDGGVDGLVPCGTTGEFASLTDEEYRTVLETTVAAAADAPVLAGTAAPSVPRTLDRIETAAEAGADAALIARPYFHTANDPAGDARFFERVADGAALPLYLYNIPACTGGAIDPDVVARVAERDAVRGLKDSSGDFDYFMTVDRRTPADFALYQGFDSHFVPGLFQGATGGINALSNVIPEVFAAAAEAAREGDLDRARTLGAERIGPLFAQCVEYGFAPATKAALAARGVLEEPTVRPPLVTLEGEPVSEIEAAVDRALDGA